MKLRGTLIPQRRSREGGQVVLSHQEPGWFDNDGAFHEGVSYSKRTVPISWWQWLGSRWFVRVKR